MAAALADGGFAGREIPYLTGYYSKHAFSFSTPNTIIERELGMLDFPDITNTNFSTSTQHFTPTFHHQPNTYTNISRGHIEHLITFGMPPLLTTRNLLFLH